MKNQWSEDDFEVSLKEKNKIYTHFSLTKLRYYLKIVTPINYPRTIRTTDINLYNPHKNI